MRKPDFCICENKDADQLRGDLKTDQHLCFRYTDSTIPLLPKTENSNLHASSVIAQPGLCRTWWENPEYQFSHNETHIVLVRIIFLFGFYTPFKGPECKFVSKVFKKMSKQ